MFALFAHIRLGCGYLHYHSFLISLLHKDIIITDSSNAGSSGMTKAVFSVGIDAQHGRNLEAITCHQSAHDPGPLRQHHLCPLLERDPS